MIYRSDEFLDASLFQHLHYIPSYVPSKVMEWDLENTTLQGQITYAQNVCRQSTTSAIRKLHKSIIWPQDVRNFSMAK